VTTVKGKYGGRKIRDGTVVSDKMQKTVVVAVEEHITHPLYKKRVRRMRRFLAHDEREEARMGDRVRILEAAPVSKRKRWQMVEVLQRVELPDVAAESIDLELLGEVKREEEPAAEEAATPPPAVAVAETAEGEVPEPAPVAVGEEVTVEETEGAETEAEPTEETLIEEPAPEEFDETPEASAEEIAELLGDETAPDAETTGESEEESK
jgi:small subunit ribosomal protein S17